MLSLGCMQLVPTFDSDKDSLLDEELWLDEHAADVGTLVHPLLYVTQLQGSILKHHLHKHSILTTRPNATTATTVPTNHTQVFQHWSVSPQTPYLYVCLLTSSRMWKWSLIFIINNELLTSESAV